MTKISADEFVHMTMAFADVMASSKSIAAMDGNTKPFIAARDELRAHLIDSAAALQLEAFCDGVNHANKGWAGDQPMQGLAMFNRAGS